jgi:cytochrome b6-f complex iron-sulfur subunit
MAAAARVSEGDGAPHEGCITMNTQDDLDEPNRRQFLANASAAAVVTLTGCGCGCSDSGHGGGSDGAGAAPENSAADGAGHPAADAARGGSVRVGKPADYPADGAYANFAKSDKVLLVRKDGQLYALSSMCTHRACNVRPAEGQIRCPCHGSRFDLAGNVTKGPATRPLPRYALATGPDGSLVVDKSSVLAAGAPGSAVNLRT